MAITSGHNVKVTSYSKTRSDRNECDSTVRNTAQLPKLVSLHNGRSDVLMGNSIISDDVNYSLHHYHVLLIRSEVKIGSDVKTKTDTSNVKARVTSHHIWWIETMELLHNLKLSL
jgi:hypothetical protein